MIKNELVEKLIEQREMLDELIGQIRVVTRVETMGRAYDRTTRNIERNLQEIRRSFIKKNSSKQEES